MPGLRAEHVAKARRQSGAQRSLGQPQTAFDGIRSVTHIHAVDESEADVGLQVQATLLVQHRTLRLSGQTLSLIHS